MKLFITTFVSLLLSVSVPAATSGVTPIADIRATEIPAALREGLETSLSQKQLDDVSEWAKNSANSIKDILIAIADLKTTNQIEELRTRIQKIVIDSAPSANETLMRYALNRTLFIDAILAKSQTNHSLRVRLHNLKNGANLALKYYEVQFQSSTATATEKIVAKFGVEHFLYTKKLSNMILSDDDAYEVYHLGYQLLQWDLVRAENKREYSRVILSIQNSIQSLNDNTTLSSRVKVQIQNKEYESVIVPELDTLINAAISENKSSSDFFHSIDPNFVSKSQKEEPKIAPQLTDWFNRCYELEKINKYSYSAYDDCIKLNENEQQRIMTKEFDVCYDINSRNLYSSDAVEKCLK